MNVKHLLAIRDLSALEVADILKLTAEVKAHPKRFRKALKGKILAMIFQKPSTRTRVSFEAGIYQLGGTGMYLSSTDLQLGRGETIADTARVLSRYVNGIMARVFSHKILIEMAEHATVPVINGLSDFLHPCQALCDVFTIQEKFGRLKGRTLAYIGDGNNVAHSLSFASARTGLNIIIATPEGYEPDHGVIEWVEKEGPKEGMTIRLTHDPIEAASHADVIYTDVWASMGQEAEHEKRVNLFKPYQINEALMAKARKGAIFMHCLPAHRGEEVTDAVADSPQSVIFDQAENRLHVQKAIMLRLMGNM